jgi:hypothetical protein
MSKDRKTAGFAAIEVLLALVVLIALAVAGYFVFNHSRGAKATAPPAGWLVYKSTHSSIRFFYPKAWRLKQTSLAGKPSYYLEDVSLTGPHSFALNFTLEKTHTRPSQSWSCPSHPKQTTVAINAQYNMVLTDRSGVSLLAADSKGSVPDDFACGSLINTLASDKLFKFSGGYTATGTTSTQSLESLANKPEVQIAKTIFSSLKQ